MAQYRLSIGIVSRSAGRSVVAMAAYRASAKLQDERYGVTHDYERRGGVDECRIVLPADAPGWAADRAALWNQVEAAETRKNSQLAREIQISLPHELDDDQRRTLTLGFAQHIADTYGFAVDTAIHAPNSRGDNRNYHGHLLMTTRPVDAESITGFGDKDRRFNNIAMKREGGANEIENLREHWEIMQNAALAKAGVRDERGEFVRVDRRSFERQGVDQEPTIKEGVAATALKRNGEESDRAAANDEIRERNAEAQERHNIAVRVRRDRLEMVELFEAMQQRQPQMLQFKRRQREIITLHDEITKLLAEAERNRKRESNRANEMLAATDRKDQSAPINDNQKNWKPLPGQSQEDFDRQMKDRAQEQQATTKPEFVAASTDERASWKPLPGQSREQFEERVEQIKQEQAKEKPEYDRDAFGQLSRSQGYSGPKF